MAISRHFLLFGYSSVTAAMHAFRRYSLQDRTAKIGEECPIVIVLSYGRNARKTGHRKIHEPIPECSMQNPILRSIGKDLPKQMIENYPNQIGFCFLAQLGRVSGVAAIMLIYPKTVLKAPIFGYVIVSTGSESFTC